MGGRCLGKLGAVLCAALLAGQAYGQERGFDNGHWRVEMTAMPFVDSGKTDRNSDDFAYGVVEYEWPTTERLCVALRMVPLFVYGEKNDGHDRSETIWGAGAGLGLRYYLTQAGAGGWFGEVCVTPLWHSDYFEDNSSRLNFMNEAGIGYMWPKSRWHATLQVQHISNAGLGSHNAGINSVGVAVGVTF